MAVDVEGDLNAGVSHLVADVFRALALGDQHRREEVPEVMKTDTGETGFCGNSAEDELIGWPKTPPASIKRSSNCGNGRAAECGVYGTGPWALRMACRRTETMLLSIPHQADKRPWYPQPQQRQLGFVRPRCPVVFLTPGLPKRYDS